MDDERVANAINLMLSERAFWPPPDHAARLTRYNENQALYEGKHTEVFTRLNKVFSDNDAEHQKMVLVFNFHKRLSTLWADMSFGETPIVKIDDEPKKKAWTRFSTETNQFWRVCYQAVIDLSRFGDCVFRIWYDEKKGARVEAVTPQKWFPVLDPFTEDPLAHVIAYTTDQYVDHVQMTILKAEIHTPGQIENRFFVVKDGRLMLQRDPADFGEESIVETNVDDMLVIPISNSTTSTESFGDDDYRVLDSIVQSLEMRYTRLARIFDYHSEPDKGVPETAFELDNAGQVRYDPNKKVWPMYQDMPLPQYITWADGGIMTAAFTHIDKLMDVLYLVSETCKAAFAIDQVGGALSGTALRLLMTIPLKKSSRMMSIMKPIVQNVVKIGTGLEVARSMAGAIVIDDFTFTPQDGLPNDKTETINNMATLANAQLVTAERATQEIFGLEGEELDAEVKKLEDQKEAAKPPIQPPPKGAADRPAEEMNAKLATQEKGDVGKI